MKRLLILFMLIPILSFAQEEEEKADYSKYLGDIVPVVDGKVVFSDEFQTPGLSPEQSFKAMRPWLEKRFSTDNKKRWGRVLLADTGKNAIVCQGNEYLVFANKALSLDRAKVYYRYMVECLPGKVKITVSNISYLYQEMGQKRVPAEEMIIGEHVMNKSRTRLYKGTGKFLIHTVDMIEKLFDENRSALNNTYPKQVANGKGMNLPRPVADNITPIVNASPTTDPAPVSAPVPHSTSMEGYKSISPDRIPGNIIKQLSESWSLITGGDDTGFNMMTASWGGLGHLYNKPVSFCFINPARRTYELMDKGDYYTISFYTEAYRDILNYCGSNSGRNTDKVAGSGLNPITMPSGSKAFSEAWLIIECKKMVSQSIAPDGMHDAELKQNWQGKETHKMFIGEIIGVWVK